MTARRILSAQSTCMCRITDDIQDRIERLKRKLEEFCPRKAHRSIAVALPALARTLTYLFESLFQAQFFYVHIKTGLCVVDLNDFERARKQ